MGLHAVKIQEINITNSSKKDIKKKEEKNLNSTGKGSSPSRICLMYAFIPLTNYFRMRLPLG